jgi:hypothetical protein
LNLKFANKVRSDDHPVCLSSADHHRIMMSFQLTRPMEMKEQVSLSLLESLQLLETPAEQEPAARDTSKTPAETPPGNA